MFYQYLKLSWQLVVDTEGAVKKIKDRKLSSGRVFLLSLISSFLLALVFFVAMVIEPKSVHQNVLGNTVFIWPGIASVIGGIIKNTIEFVFMFYGWTLTLWAVAYIFRNKITYKKIIVTVVYFFPSYVVYFLVRIFIPMIGDVGALLYIVVKIVYIIFFINGIRFILSWKMWKSIMILLITHLIFIIVVLTIGRLIMGALSLIFLW